MVVCKEKWKQRLGVHLELLEGEARQLFPEEEELSKQTKLKVPNVTMMLVFVHECEECAV